MYVNHRVFQTSCVHLDLNIRHVCYCHGCRVSHSLVKFATHRHSALEQLVNVAFDVGTPFLASLTTLTQLRTVRWPEC